MAVRDVGHLRQLLPSVADSLLQNMSNSVLGSVDMYTQQPRQAVWRAVKACPFLPISWRSSVVQDAVHLTGKLYDTVAQGVPATMQRDHLLTAKRCINRQFVVLPLDKNPGRPIVVCRKLYHNLLLSSYGDTTQFEPIADFSTVERASQYTLGVLKQRAGNMGQHFKSGRRFKPPSTFLMVKNKSQEEKGEGLKVRLVFSYFAHPMKSYAKKVGRSLTLLSKRAQELLPTFEMQNISDIVSWARHTDAALRQRAQLRGRPRRDRGVRLWELDVKEMFPRLKHGDPEFEPLMGPAPNREVPKEPGVWEAIQLLCHEVREAGRIRACTAGPWFGLGPDRVHDVMRKAYGDMFTNLSWAHVSEYLHFDLFQNDLFLLGTRVFRQRRGVAIGGVLSAQCASLYCMYREFQWLRAHGGSRAWARIPGLLAQPFRFRDNIVGVRQCKVSVEALQKRFEKILGLQLQIEGEGQVWTSLEAKLMLRPEGQGLDIGLKDRTGDCDPMRAVRRYPDVLSPNARPVLRSLVPGLIYKSLQYAFDANQARQNLRAVGRDLAVKGYPQSWWLGAAKAALRVQRISLRAPSWAITENHGFLPCLLAATAAPLSRSD